MLIIVDFVILGISEIMMYQLYIGSDSPLLGNNTWTIAFVLYGIAFIILTSLFVIIIPLIFRKHKKTILKICRVIMGKDDKAN